MSLTRRSPSVTLRLSLATLWTVALTGWVVPCVSWERPIPGPRGDDTALHPADSLAYLEVRGLGSLATRLPDTTLAARVMEFAPYQAFLAGEEGQQLEAVLALVKSLSGMEPQELAGQLLGESLGLSIHPPREGGEPAFLLTLRTASDDTAQRMLDMTVGFARMNPEAKVEEGEHRGVRGFGINKLNLARIGPTVVVATESVALKGAIDRGLDTSRGLAATEAGRQVRAALQSGHAGAFFVDVGTLRTMVPDSPFFAAQRLDNAGASLFFHDVMHSAQHAGRVHGTVEATTQQLAVSLDVPAPWPDALRSFATANDLQRTAMPLTSVQGFTTIAGFRDVAQWWADRAELMTEETEPAFAEFESGLAQFFGGRSIPDDILPMIDPEIQLVGARQTFASGPVPPQVRYPCGAAILRSSMPDDLEREMTIAMQSTLGIVNLDRGMKGLSALMIFRDDHRGVAITGGRFVEGDGRQYDSVRFNLSPSMARVGDRIVLSTSDELTRDLVDQLLDEVTTEPLPPGTLTHVRMDPKTGVELIRENFDAIVAMAVVDEGKPFDQAEAEWTMVTELLSLVDRMDVGTRRTEDGMALNMTLDWNDPAPFALRSTTSGAKSGSVR